MSRLVIIAPDSLKGTARADEAALALAEGWRSERPDDELRLFPMADGGEGTIDAFALAYPAATRMPVTVHGPLGVPVEAEWLLLPVDADGHTTAVVELALCSGITLLDELAPLDAHTLGFGEAIAAALDHGVDSLLLAIGGSSSTDAGAGALAALGARFTDASGRPVRLGNRGLASIAKADLSAARTLPRGGITILSDVSNPLLGEKGAAVVFGPQKGANAATMIGLEQSLARFARLFDGTPGAARAGGNTVSPEAPGTGAAGGTAFGLLAWGATLAPGSRAVAEAIGLPAAVTEADIVVTGEGRFDAQSADGKVVGYVAELARESGARVAIAAGIIDAGAAARAELAASASLLELAGSAEVAMGDTLHWLREAGANLARQLEP